MYTHARTTNRPCLSRKSALPVPLDAPACPVSRPCLSRKSPRPVPLATPINYAYSPDKYRQIAAKAPKMWYFEQKIALFIKKTVKIFGGKAFLS